MEVRQDGSKVKLQSNDIHATYEGTLSSDGKKMSGTWSQGQPVDVAFEKTDHPWAIDTRPAPPSDIDGRWQGKLDFGSTTLRLVFRFTNTQSGVTGTVQSPDQSPGEVPLTSVERSDSKISIHMKQFAAEFSGTIAEDRQSMAGTFIQNGNSIPLTVSRTKE